MSTEKDASVERKCYQSPKLTIHGDVDAITLGDELGEELDGSFTTSSIGPAVKGSKKPKKQTFS